MKRILYISILLLGIVSANAQVKFVANLDTNYLDNHYWNDSTDFNAFLSDSRLDEELDPLNPDIDLINAVVYAYIQKGRSRSGKKQLEFSKKQYTLCKNFVDYFMPGRFENESENIERFEKLTKKSLKKMKFNKGISKVLSFKVRAMDFKGNNFYYLASAHETELKLFKGNKPEIRDSAKLAELEKDPLKTYTYRKFAENFYLNVLRKKYNKLIHSAEYSSMGVYFKMDPRTIFRRAVPEFAVIIVLGADRLKQMDKAIVKSKRQRKLV